MADNVNDLCFAQIIPINPAAHKIFEAAVAEAIAQANRDSLHLYKNPVRYATQQVQGNGGQASADTTPLNAADALASLSIADSLLPQYSRLGWRVGRRCSLVDVAIAASDHHEDLKFRLSLHPKSGLLILHAGVSTTHLLRYVNAAQDYVPLSPQQELVLLSPSTRVAIDGYEFEISYTINNLKRGRFYPQLSTFLLRHWGNRLHDVGNSLPSDTYFHIVGNYAMGNILGSGTFGDVRYAIDRTSGDPVAVKDVRAYGKQQRGELKREISVLEEVKDDSSFLHLHNCWCSAHDLHPSQCTGTDPEHFYMATEIALGSFSDPVFKGLPFEVAINLFGQILVGIHKLHGRGVMHRDITALNLFVTSTEPPKAVIGDFGKAVRTLRDTEQLIGPVPFCAPEVWEGDYNQAIDLWSWAFVVLNYLGYSPTRKLRKARISKEKLETMTAFLKTKAEEPEASEICGLLLQILVWDVKDRISVEKALEHPMWPRPAAEEADNDEDPERSPKRARTGSVAAGESEQSDGIQTLPLSEAS